MEVRLCFAGPGQNMISKQDHILIAGLGIQFAVIMCIGAFGGYWLDKKFGTLPVFILSCSAAAFSLVIYIMVRSAKAYVYKDKKK